MAFVPTSTRALCELVGLPAAKRQIAALPEAARKAFGAVAKASAERIAVRGRALAPVRQEAVGTYRGGALKAAIDAKPLPATATALVGIRRGLTVVTRQGRQVQVTRSRSFRRASARPGAGGRYRALLQTKERARIRAAGHLILQPTKYGHFWEFGSRRQHGHPWLRQAAAAELSGFELAMRSAARSVEHDLAAMGTTR